MICQNTNPSIFFYETQAFFNAQIYFDKGQGGLELAKKHTILAQNQIQLIIDSHNKLVQENVEVPSCIFEPAVARRILATAPPNTIPLPSFETVRIFFDKKAGQFYFQIRKN